MTKKVNFKITPERVAEACSYIEYMNLTLGDKGTIMIVAPRFVLKEDGEYIMSAKLDSDGDIESFDGYVDAISAMGSVTPKRLEKLTPEFREAARSVVNPQKGGG